MKAIQLSKIWKLERKENKTKQKRGQQHLYFGVDCNYQIGGCKPTLSSDIEKEIDLL